MTTFSRASTILPIMFEVYFHGALRVLIDSNGKIVAVQDRVSGVAATLRYSDAYIAQASTAARNAWESQHAEA